MQSTEQVPSRTDAPQVTPSSSSSGATPAALADRPQNRLTAVMPEALRAIDWNGHVPTAPRGPVTMTRAQVSDELAATDGGDDNDPWLPKLPGPRQPSDQATEVPAPRRSPEQPEPKIPGQRGAYDRELLGSAA